MKQNRMKPQKQHVPYKQRIAMKICILFFILSLTLPFYGGITTSALEDLKFTHYQDQVDELIVDREEQAPSAKVDHTTSRNETSAPVQVIPLPTKEPNVSPSPMPTSPSASTPSPTPIPTSSLGNNTAVPDNTTAPDNPAFPEITTKPGRTPKPKDGFPTHTPTPSEMPANAGVLLQNLLDSAYRHDGEKVAYLTFDDGPTPSLTNPILDILTQENVKATFFIIGTSAEKHPEPVRRAYNEGHGIGNHTYSHVFKRIYAKPKNFIDELHQNEKVLKTILGEDKTFRLIRFPGGSFGKTLKPFREATNEAGFGYIDWNSLNGDAESVKAKSPDHLIARLKETVNGQSGLIVLMHDAPHKETTVEALSEAIQFLKAEGYRFDLLPGSR